jgi:enoyl-CoA hydratase/carnithine racemase
MDRPKKLNGWTEEMMASLLQRLRAAARDDATRGVVLTGTDPYYSAGVNLGGSLALGHPKTLHAEIARRNQALFDAFLDFDKPILAAVNGPAIGAVVTSATLCDGILASERATFSTPFARLGVPPEGCSSVTFARLFGEATAQRILGDEGWKPTAEDALEIGLVDAVVPHEQLLDEAIRTAKRWIEEGRQRTFPAGLTRAELKAINARESQEIATAFLSAPFLRGQRDFLRSRKKRVPAAMFALLLRTRPLWGRLL